MPESVSTLNNEPVTQGTQDASGNVVVAPQVIPAPSRPVPVHVFKHYEEHEIEEAIENQVIEPYGKGVKYTLVYSD